jgi:hypothetical protein
MNEGRGENKEGSGGRRGEGERRGKKESEGIPPEMVPLDPQTNTVKTGTHLGC